MIHNFSYEFSLCSHLVFVCFYALPTLFSLCSRFVLNLFCFDSHLSRSVLTVLASFSLCFHFVLILFFIDSHLLTQGKRERPPSRKGKRERPSSRKGKRERPRTDAGAAFSLGIGHRAYARTHARTKRNDFPVGLTPPGLRYIYIYIPIKPTKVG